MPRKVLKDSEEVVRAFGVVSRVIANELKDGFQVATDIPTIMSNLALKKEYRDALTAAGEGIQNCKAELQANGARGGLSIGIASAEEADKLLELLEAPTE